MPYDAVIDFFIFGLILNGIGACIGIVAINLKVRNFSIDECTDYMKFSYSRKMFMITQVTEFARALRCLTVLVPGHLLVLSIVFSYNLIRYRGVQGIIRGVSQMERISIMPLVNYNLKELDK